MMNCKCTAWSHVYTQVLICNIYKHKMCIFIDAKMYNSDVFQPLKRKNLYVYLGKIRTNM